MDYLCWVYWLGRGLSLRLEPTKDSPPPAKGFRGVNNKLHQEPIVLVALSDERLRGFPVAGGYPMGEIAVPSCYLG